MITVLLADANIFVRKEFRRILEGGGDIEVVGEARTGRQAVLMAKSLLPALVLMDVAMPLKSGLEATRDILKTAPTTKVLMLSVHRDEAYVEEATRSGAMGYLLKDTCAHSVCDAVRQVESGKTFFSPEIPSHLHTSRQNA